MTGARPSPAAAGFERVSAFADVLHDRAWKMTARVSKRCAKSGLRFPLGCRNGTLLCTVACTVTSLAYRACFSYFVRSMWKVGLKGLPVYLSIVLRNDAGMPLRRCCAWHKQREDALAYRGGFFEIVSPGRQSRVVQLPCIGAKKRRRKLTARGNGSVLGCWRGPYFWLLLESERLAVTSTRHLVAARARHQSKSERDRVCFGHDKVVWRCAKRDRETTEITNKGKSQQCLPPEEVEKIPERSGGAKVPMQDLGMSMACG